MKTLFGLLYRYRALFTGLITIVFLYMAFYYWFQGSIHFYTDIGRDFLLLEDMARKKFVLIGARTSFGGIFHGPLWHYIQLPVFFITNGNPMGMTVYWMLLLVSYCVSAYMVTAKLISRNAGLVALLAAAINVVYVTKWFTNPAGSLIIGPVFIYTIIKYLQSNQVKYAWLHFLTAGAMIQFEMMIGVPLALLSVGICGWRWLTKKQYAHAWSLVALALMVATFFLFEFRNNFLQIRSFYKYQFGGAYETHSFGSFTTFFLQRFDIVTRSGIGIFMGDYAALNTLPFVLIILAAVKQKRWNKWPVEFGLPLYYFFGYFGLTLLYRDTLLWHYIWPVSFFPILALSYSLKYASKIIVAGLVGLMVIFGYLFGKEQIAYANNSINQIEDDWKFLSGVSRTVYADNEADLGYFIYTPDVFAYEQKYAMSYQTRIHPAVTTHVYEKRPVTYLVIAPPSGLGTEMTSEYWKKNKLRLTRPADKVIQLGAGYQVEKYLLSDAEIATGVDSTVNDWIHFR